MSVSSVRSNPEGTPSTSDGLTRPGVEVALLATGDRARLARVLATLLPAARDFGVRVRVVWPGTLEAAERRAFEADGVALLELPAGTAATERRREAVTRSAADITTVIEESRAESELWSEVLAIRCGLVRHPETGRSPTDWRGVLTALGVQSPAR